jgi:secreted trypsin-like serine protease
MLIKMKLAWSFIAPLLVLSSTVAAASHERDLLQGIVGGTTTNASDFPFFVQSQVIGPVSMTSVFAKLNYGERSLNQLLFFHRYP